MPPPEAPGLHYPGTGARPVGAEPPSRVAEGPGGGGGLGRRSPPAPSHYGDEAAVMPLARGLRARAGM